jgi:hypothetical protein
MVLGLDMRFPGQKRRKEYKSKAKAIKSVASRSALRFSLRQSGMAFGRFLYGTRERVPFRCRGRILAAGVNLCPPVLWRD